MVRGRYGIRIGDHTWNANVKKVDANDNDINRDTMEYKEIKYNSKYPRGVLNMDNNNHDSISGVSDLLPCPKCNSKDIEYEFSASQGYIKCNKCGHEGDYADEAADPICSITAANAAWNNR